MTNKERVLWILQDGEKYSVGDFHRLGCGWDGRKIISLLRKDKHEIDSEWVKGEWGNRYKKYFLHETR